MKAHSQKQMIAEHLENFGSIEPLEALREYGVYRLGAIIFNLKAEGVKIRTERQYRRSKITGKPVRFAKYYLEPEPTPTPCAI